MAAELEETKRLLALEYEQVRRKIDTFDDMRFKTKGWCLTVAGGLLALAIHSKSLSLCLLALTAAWFFGYIEIVYIQREEILFDRSDYLEEVMESIRRGDPSQKADTYIFGIRCAFPKPTPRRVNLDALWHHPQTGALYGGLTIGIIAVAISLAGG